LGKQTQLTEYIGDGVYVIFDGFGFWLHANDHECPTDKIYLEPSVLQALNRFAKSAIEVYRHALKEELDSNAKEIGQ